MAKTAKALDQELRDVRPVSGNGGGQAVVVYSHPEPGQLLAALRNLRVQPAQKVKTL